MIGVVLFAQMAVAAYACPGVSAAIERAQQGEASVAATGMAIAAVDGKAVAAADTSAVPEAMDCEHMAAAGDETSPNLCAQHCQQGNQGDLAATVTVPPVVLTGFYVLAPPSQAGHLPAFFDARTGVLAAVSPPHSILHCRFQV